MGPSLNSYVPWTSVLPILGVEISGSALPAVVRCPICQALTLTVYRDPAKPCQWYVCSSCGFAGDAVELTATVGNISPGSAILKLAARGLSIPPKFLEPDQIDRHIARIDRRKRNNAFWSAARLSTDNTGNT